MQTATNNRFRQVQRGGPYVHEPPIGTSPAEQQLKKDQRHQNMLDFVVESEEKTAAKRVFRQQALLNKEREIEENILRNEQAKSMRDEAHEQEMRLANELERLKLEQLKDSKLRQQLRESSYEIRQLESKLREGYVNKERHAQMAEKEAHKFDSLVEDAEIMKRMKAEAERAAYEQGVRDQAQFVENRKYKQDIHKQIEEKEEAKQKAYEEFLKEKLLVDEIVRKLYEEDQREIERKMLSQQATKEYIHEFKKQREAWKQQEKEIMEAENRKIQEYAKEQKHRDDVLQANKKAKEEQVEKLQQKLFDQIESEAKYREEMEQVREELYLEEQEQAVRHKERAEFERKVRQRLEMQQEHFEQVQFKAMREEAERAEEEKIKNQMLEKFAADDRIEQMNAQKRRMKQLEHKRQVENLLEDRRHRLNIEKQRELNERIESDKLENHKRQIIEEERAKLLQEHAVKLLGYLPKGVIRNSGDLDLMGSDFKRQYQKRQVNFFGDEDQWTQGGDY